MVKNGRGGGQFLRDYAIKNNPEIMLSPDYGLAL
jgi:hypothetical protein